MPLLREAWQEDLLEPGPQYLPPGSYTQAETRGITEYYAPVKGIEDNSDTPSLSNGEGDHHLGRCHQVIQYNLVQNPSPTIEQGFSLHTRD